MLLHDWNGRQTHTSMHTHTHTHTHTHKADTHIIVRDLGQGTSEHTCAPPPPLSIRGGGGGGLPYVPVFLHFCCWWMLNNLFISLIEAPNDKDTITTSIMRWDKIIKGEVSPNNNGLSEWVSEWKAILEIQQGYNLAKKKIKSICCPL